MIMQEQGGRYLELAEWDGSKKGKMLLLGQEMRHKL